VYGAVCVIKQECGNEKSWVQVCPNWHFSSCGSCSFGAVWSHISVNSQEAEGLKGAGLDLMPLKFLQPRRFLILLAPSLAYNLTYGCKVQIIIVCDLMVAALARRVCGHYHVISVVDIENTLQIDTIVKKKESE
jgi:hypothetical protein